MKTLSIFLGKLLAKIGNLMGKGSSLPGKVASRIDPNILSKMHLPTTIMVSGTNGKTSTAHFIKAILEEEATVIHNAEGANMPQGIATILIKNSNMGGNVAGDYVVLEVDEGFLKEMSESIHAHYLVLTNISQDQIDRFTSLKMVENLIRDGVKEDTVLVINGNDPSLVNLSNSLDNEAVYYGLDLSQGSADFSCPSCGKALTYKKEYYGNIGVFKCSCGLRTPDLDYLGKNIDLESGEFTVDGFKYQTSYQVDYMIYNLMAAISLARELDISEKTIGDAIKDYQIGSGRMETIRFAGQDSIFNLVKNPAGLSRSLDYISSDQEAYNIYFAINNRPADGEDISWLNNVDFSKISPENFVLDGEAAGEASHILKEKGLDLADLSLADLYKDPNKTYFLTSYTAMNSLKEKLKPLK